MSRIVILIVVSLAFAFSEPIRHFSEFNSMTTKSFKQSTSICPNVSADGVNPIGRAGQAPTSAQFNDGACSWYKDSSCCSAADAQFIRNSATIDLESSRCRNLIVLGACAVCSPTVGNLYSNSKGIPICLDFCSRVYAACKSQRNLNTGEFYIDPTQSVEEFCQGAEDSEDSRVCFNSGSYFAPIFLFVLISSLL